MRVAIACENCAQIKPGTKFQGRESFEELLSADESTCSSEDQIPLITPGKVR